MTAAGARSGTGADAVPAAPERWQGLCRVLAVRLDNLGDLLMTTPALAAIRESLPGVDLTLLTSPSGSQVAPYLTMVDRVWTWRASWTRIDGPVDDDRALVDRLAAGGFDAAVIFTVCTQSALLPALLCRMAGIPLRAAHCRENPYELLTDWLPETDAVVPGLAPERQQALARHEVERQLALVGALGWHTRDDRLRFAVRPGDRAQVAAQLRAGGVAATLAGGAATGAPYAVLHTGASAESRRWPAEHFGKVARDLAAGGCAVVFAGTHADIGRTDEALHAMGGQPGDGTAAALSLVGRQTLGELAALIEGARVLVANNSAPAHLAAAVGTPVVDLYALTNPQHTPWRVASRVLSHDVPCRWCLKSVCPQGHNDCLRRVRPAQAAQAAFELMHLPQRRPPPK